MSLHGLLQLEALAEDSSALEVFARFVLSSSRSSVRYPFYCTSESKQLYHMSHLPKSPVIHGLLLQAAEVIVVLVRARLDSELASCVTSYIGCNRRATLAYPISVDPDRKAHIRPRRRSTPIGYSQNSGSLFGFDMVLCKSLEFFNQMTWPVGKTE